MGRGGWVDGGRLEEGGGGVKESGGDEGHPPGMCNILRA